MSIDKDNISLFYKSKSDFLLQGFGIKQEFVHEDSKNLMCEFICQICLNLVHEPQECAKCDHLFCTACIDKWLEEAEGSKCPNRCEKFSNKMNQKIKNLLNLIKLYCVNKNSGCDKIVNYESFSSHLNECNFNKFKCLSEGCIYEGNKEQIIDHFKNCEYIFTNCNFCYQDIKKNKLEEHLEYCKVRIHKNSFNKCEENKNCLNKYSFENSKFLNKKRNDISNENLFCYIEKEIKDRLEFENYLDEVSEFNEFYYKNDSTNYEINKEKIKLLKNKFLNFSINAQIKIPSTSTIIENDLNDLNNRKFDKGLCSAAPGEIIIELNNFYNFNEIEVAGFKYKINNNNYVDGANSTIYVSQDGSDWREVGMIPSDFNTKIIKLKLLRSFSKFIRFSNQNAIGISYLNILPINTIYYDEIHPLFIDYSFSGEYVDAYNEVQGSNEISSLNGSERDSFYAKPKGYLLLQLKFPRCVNYISLVSPQKNIKYSKDVYVSLSGLEKSWERIGNYENKATFLINNQIIKYIKIVNERNKDPLGISSIIVK